MNTTKSTINFDYKIQFIGYCKDNIQNVRPEELRKEEAEELAKLFKKSFINITDENFKSILNSNNVLIFRDNDENLYAYSPANNLAQLISEVHNPGLLNKPLVSFKNWFKPGTPFVIKSETGNQIMFCDINWKDHSYKVSDFKISRHAADVMVHLGRNTYPLWLSEDTISFRDLKKIIKHEWTCLQEYNPNDSCSNMCGNYCFYCRCHKTYIQIRFNKTFKDDIQKRIDFLHEIEKPFSFISDQYDNNNFDGLYGNIQFIREHSGLFRPYNILYNKIYELRNLDLEIKKLQEYRDNKNSEKIRVQVVSSKEVKNISVLKEAISTSNTGILWWEKHIIFINGYDYNSDCFIKDIRIELDDFDIYDFDMIRDKRVKTITMRRKSSGRWALECK